MTTTRLPLVTPSARGASAPDAMERAPEGAPSLERRLRTRTAPAALFERADEHVRCLACAHRCLVHEGRAGACGVRFVENGILRAPFGYVARHHVRPIETNTVYHVLPGSLALTFGMYGCDLRCGYCHNWHVSQALREGRDVEAPRAVSPDGIASLAVEAGCRAVCAAYNEPMIAAEWVRAVFVAARARGLRTLIVSDGHTTPEALAHVRSATDVFRVDLKGYEADHYRQLGGRLEPVFEAIARAKAMGLWVEVVTLVVPGFNDDERGIRRLATRLAAIDPAMPWHLNAFQPRYRMRDRPAASAAVLTSMAGIAFGRGLRFVYVGNVHDAMGELEHTRCPQCGDTLVERRDYRAHAVRLVGPRPAADPDPAAATVPAACPSCGLPVPGIWS